MMRNPFLHPNRKFSSGFYGDADLHFEVRTTLGKAAGGAADIYRNTRKLRSSEDGPGKPAIVELTAG
ncbi:hypothetical protein [Rhizobium sp. BK251]|uniref:hypothetical protein n=1 Tax=Rhizobium sp. BK251 TaxID=2512125 RepID=UPI0010474B63|nr:hypothetical protein [Rhizobium sp. BK251]TCL64700.1 hypothetical protein EV286_114121 [Rhizobium sp. BK251]